MFIVRFFVLIAAFLIMTNQAVAEETVSLGQMFVTATRTEEPVEEVPSSVTVVTSEEIERLQATDVSEALRFIPALDVVQSGGPGKATSVYIRGGNSGHTLVMIDGVQVNSPTLGSYDFSDLIVDNIERIEVVRGPQSTLYGSDAMAGVINIITKKGKGPAKLAISGEAGSYKTSRFSASVSGGTNKGNYSIAVSRFDTEGVSGAESGSEDDGYGNTTISGRFGYHLNGSILLDLGLRYTEAKSDLDSFGADDPNYTQDSTQKTAFAKITHIVSGDWDHSLKISQSNEALDYDDPDTAWNNASIDTKIENADWQHNVYFFDGTNTMTFGLEYEKQSGENKGVFDKSIESRAFYLQDQASLIGKRLNLIAGLRVDDHSKFGDGTTYKAAASYLFEKSGTRLKGSYGTGFKAPTLNDLFYQDPWGNLGNPDLMPEKSVGCDLGIEQSLGKEVTVSATYFQTDFEDLIQWVDPEGDWSYTPENVSEAEIRGWEFGLTANLPMAFRLKASYSITKTEDEATGNDLARRPEDKASAILSWNPKGGNITGTYNYVGDRWDDKDNTEKIDSYTKFDVAASYDLAQNLSLFGRVENLTDEDYEEAKGFGTLGRAYYAGVKATF